MQQLTVDAFVQIKAHSISFLTGAQPHMRIAKTSNVVQAVAEGTKFIWSWYSFSVPH